MSKLCIGWNIMECAWQARESHETVIDFSRKLHSAFFIWIETHDHSVNMSSFLQVQQLYTVGIRLRHTYCQSIIELVSPKNKMAASHVVQIHTHTRFPWSKKWPTYHVTVCRTNRKRSSFATKHFQRKSLKVFDLHPPLRRLVLFVARIIM